MPRSLDPTNIEAQRIVNNGFAETLLLPLNDGSVRPWLAKSWTNVDPLTWRVELQPNVKFWSGAAVDAAAVKASMLRFVELSPTAKARLAGVSMEVRNPLTLEFRTAQPNPVFIYNFTAFPIHNAAEAQRRGDRFASEPDLTGFMLVDKYVPGELVVAKPNPNYWGKKAQIDRFEIRQAKDPQARLLALRSGDADINYNVEVDDYPQAKSMAGVDLYSYGSITRNVWFNIARVPAFAELSVRRALSYAVDRQQLFQSIYHGAGQAPTGHFPAGLPYALDNGGDQFDLAKAQQLLYEAGYTLGPDGIRQKNGKRMSYAILTYERFLSTAIALQGFWKKLGVEITIDQVETTASNAAMLRGDFDLATYCSCPMPTAELGNQLNAFYRTGAPSNYGRFSSQRIDGLLDGFSTAFKQDEQYRLAKEVQEALLAETPTILVHSGPFYWIAARQRVQGIDPLLPWFITPEMRVSS